MTGESFAARGLTMLYLMSDRQFSGKIGIISDERAMYDLLSKFLSREGYQVVEWNVSFPLPVSLLIVATTRLPGDSYEWVIRDGLARNVLFLLQCCGEETPSVKENFYVYSEAPMNLSNLNNMIKEITSVENKAAEGISR
ncbi:MAG: hypothetical protein ACP5MI_05010 [Candidatus Kryptoniota bacterium]